MPCSLDPLALTTLEGEKTWTQDYACPIQTPPVKDIFMEQAEGSIGMAQEKHWVEKLFSPHFNTQDFLSQTHQPESWSEKLALDRVKRVEEIYNLAIKKFQEEKKLKRNEFTAQLIEQEWVPKLTEGEINISKKEVDGNCACRGATNLGLGTEESIEETEGYCIWNAKELAALRQEMHKNRAEGISQKIQLSSLNAEMEELKAKCRKLEVDFENAEKELLNSKKEICFKTLHLQQVQRDNLRKDRELQALKRDLSEEAGNVKNLTKALLQAREVIQKLELENEDLKETVKKLKQQSELGGVAMKEKMKLDYDLKMMKIERKLESIKSELETEKSLHAKNSKALELFRKHFSSLPVMSTHDNFKVDFL
ncbi:coiled-coil domain-containing protein 160 isoform X1 [Tachyglossus aculeatus]|uniref:coiled-coil domain-containing protein 160 isoform X1 n=3 Tax=Tachyglossus aculeatus TaxID=9261 RepID=UPI0018F2C05D|nr:coiled-coil domain-containing protein 160 isoform X1 [Tachyglossus aculeatus]